MSAVGRLAIAVLACVCNLAVVQAQPVKLGELNSYKQFPAFLEPYKKGMDLALAEVNAAGGVLGRPLEIVSRDDNGTPGDAVRVAEELVARERVVMLMGTFASNVGLAVADFAQSAQGTVPRRGTPDRQDRLGERQSLHVPPARLHLHADSHAGTRSRKARQEALGDRVPQLRIRTIRHRGVQEADEFPAVGRPRVHRDRGAAGQDRCGPGRAGADRRRSPMRFSRRCSAPTLPASYARASCAACSRTGPCSTCWAANPSISIR